MWLTAKKFYILLVLLLLSAYGYLAYQYLVPEHPNHKMGVCMVKQVSGYPCPSCGSTRSLMLISQGKLEQALFTNPLGFLHFAALTLLPLALMFDFIRKDTQVYQGFLKLELWIRKPLIAWPLTLLILANWLWNLNKGL